MNQAKQLSLDEALHLAVAAHQTGRAQEAETWYRAILQAAPQHVHANHNLGLLLQQYASSGAGLPYLEAAYVLAPDNPQFVLSYAASLAENNSSRSRKVLEDAVARGIVSAEIWCNLANLFRADGALTEAKEALREALRLRPDYAIAYFNLALIEQEEGAFDTAIANFQQAIAHQANFAQAHNELGLILLSRGEVLDANVHFRSALAADPDFMAAGVNLVNTQMTLQHWTEALDLVQHVIARHPDCAAAYHNLGTIHRYFNHFVKAESAYRHALEIIPSFVEAMLGLAAVIRYQSTDETIALCRHILEIKSDFAAARVLLAECWSSQGRFAEAEAELRYAIASEPRLAEAWAAMTGLRKMAHADDRWLSYVQMLADNQLSPEKEVFLRYALGKSFDDLSDYSRAFHQFRIANDLSKQFTVPYHREMQEQQTNWICADYDHDWMRKQAQRTGAIDSMRPVFVLGMPRSGTSLVEQILSAHPSAAGAGELAFWRNASVQFSPFASNDKERRLPSAQELINLGKAYLEQLSVYGADTLRVIDKMPANFQCLGLIHAALPNARIIHVQRNPIDTCLSIYFQHFESYHSYANDLENLVHFYRLYRRLMAHWTLVLPKESILHLSYEALVQNQEAETRKLLDFIGLPWDDACLQFQRVERRVGTASNWQVRQPINHRSVERWRHYADELGPLLNFLDDGK